MAKGLVPLQQECHSLVVHKEQRCIGSGFWGLGCLRSSILLLLLCMTEVEGQGEEKEGRKRDRGEKGGAAGEGGDGGEGGERPRISPQSVSMSA